MLIFLDTETTGLDPAKHDVWEVAWSLGEDIYSTQLLHDLSAADPKALELNGYWDRFNVDLVDRAGDLRLKEILRNNTIVGSNPTFDAGFLRERWQEAPWKHRLIGIETMAFTVFGYEEPKGMAAVASDLKSAGYKIDEPNHTAQGDVKVLIACYNALRELAADRSK